MFKVVTSLAKADEAFEEAVLIATILADTPEDKVSNLPLSETAAAAMAADIELKVVSKLVTCDFLICMLVSLPMLVTIPCSLKVRGLILLAVRCVPEVTRDDKLRCTVGIELPTLISENKGAVPLTAKFSVKVLYL